MPSEDEASPLWPATIQIPSPKAAARRLPPTVLECAEDQLAPSVDEMITPYRPTETIAAGDEAMASSKII
jgi:hypothetical protein